MWSGCRLLSQWGLFFILLGVDAILGNGCRIREHLNSSREVKWLQSFPKRCGCVDITLRTPHISTENSLVIIVVGL